MSKQPFIVLLLTVVEVRSWHPYLNNVSVQNALWM